MKPLGQAIEFAKGPDLDSSTDPWAVDDGPVKPETPIGRPPNRQFKGYSLDKSRRPTFRYVFGSVEVEDFFSQLKSRRPASKAICSAAF